MKKKLHLLLAGLIFYSSSIQAVNYYWVGGTGNWSNYAAHWATTSGGNVFHVQVPTSFDNVYFDANSFTAPGQIVTNDTTIAYCRDMDWTGANAPVFEAANTSIQLKIFGSLTLNPVVNFAFNGQLLFTSFNPGKTIQTFSRVLQCPVEFNGAGGEWNMLDSLTTTKNITLTYGTLRTNNHNMRCLSFYSYNNNSRSFYLGTSTVFITNVNNGEWEVSASLTIDADSSIIRFRDDGYFRASGQTYHILQWDSTGMVGSNEIYGDGGGLTIHKIISLNPHPFAELRLDHHPNSHIDSIFVWGKLRADMGGFNHINYIWVDHDANISDQSQDTILKMVVNEDLTYTSAYPNSFFHDLTVGGNLTVSQGSSIFRNMITFDSCTVFGNATFLSGSNQLGVFTMTPGKTLTLKNDSTQYIDSLSATGTAGFPIQIVSSDLGLAANVDIQKSLCTNYLYIHAVHATSPNLLYVGNNSNDVANNTGWIFTSCLPTGIEENSEDALSLFPNPATEELRIKNTELRIEKVEIYDAIGQSVLNLNPEAGREQVRVDVSGLNPGIYFLKIRDGQRVYSEKFIKE